ncbi:MAG: hypothetical protein IKH88_06645 [Prevotella sp.]|nr:hypothetical protein [Prevotella sp.]
MENRQECSAWKTAKNVQLGKPLRMFCFETAKNVLPDLQSGSNEYQDL